MLSTAAERFLDTTNQYVRRNGSTEIGGEALAAVFGISGDAFTIEDAWRIAKIFEDKFGLTAKAQYEFGSDAQKETVVVCVAKDWKTYWMAFK